MKNKSKLNFGKLKYYLPVKHLSGGVIEMSLVLVPESEERAGLDLNVIGTHQGFKAMEPLRPSRMGIYNKRRKEGAPRLNPRNS